MGITTSLPKQKQELLDACRTGDLQTIKELIENKVNINQFDKNKLSPLHLAVSNGHVEIAQLLLENAAGVDIRVGEIGPTALMNSAFHPAAVNGHDELV